MKFAAVSNPVKIFKTLLMILIISLLTYSVMAVITHFSLHYQLPDYRFIQSLISVFDFRTDIFKFFSGFMIINIIWISAAVLILFLKKIIKSKI